MQSSHLRHLPKTILAAALALLATLLLVGSPLRASGEELTFVQLSDLHADKPHLRILGDFVDRINALPMPVAFVVVTGDIFKDNILDTNIVAQTRAALNRLTMPVHLLPGNHDILQKKLPTTLAVYTNQVGGLISTAVYHNVGCVFAYTEPLARDFTCPGYDPLAAIGAALRALAPRPIIVFHHTPSVDDFYRGEIHPGWPRQASEAWTALLSTNNVSAIVAGHFHRDELRWVGDIPLYVGQPIALFWGRQPSFRIYTWRNGKLAYRTVYER
jgi:Icc-related predicted phosphoesterase